MLPLAHLKRAAQEAVTYLRTVPDVVEAEVFVSSNANLLARLSYTSNIPSNGVEEPKSLESDGIGLRVVFKGGSPLLVGFGSESGDVSLTAVREALDKARKGAVRDPEFISLPRLGDRPRKSISNYHDSKLMHLSDRQLVELGWAVVDGTLDAFQSSEELLEWAKSPEAIPDLGLILTGDVIVLQERIALGGTGHDHVLTDESALITSMSTSMVEQQFTKGTGWQVGSRLDEFQGTSGAEAARNAIRAAGGSRVHDGEYRVVLGPQPVTDLTNNLLLPSVQLGTFQAWASPFEGLLGKRIASSLLSVYDHGALRGHAASKGITDEGLPTGRTDLIRNGRLVGLLSNWYETQRILHDPDAKEKLGVDPALRRKAIAPRNGFRTGLGGGRHFDRDPGVTPTNVIIEGSETVPSEELLRRVGNGLYIGRIWYTYPINGITQADFTCTVVGDSYIIRDGRIAEPLKPNTVRINDNLRRVLNGVLGIGDTRKPTIVWSADEMVHAPEIAVEALQINEIGEFLETAS
jgi:predicted Zn-dependent protease